jgi:curved DNA-binding protein
MPATDYKDYYSILGVSKTASADEIKQAFRKQARKYHPDMNPGDKAAEARFKEINEAYEVLSDPEKRQKYDQFGQYWNRASGVPGGQGSPFGGNPFGGGTDFDGFEFGQYATFDDFINALLGRMGSDPFAGRSPGRSASSTGTNFSTNTSAGGGLDSEAKITLTLSEAFRGVQKRLTTGREEFEVRIPAGIRVGNRIRVRGKGQPSPYQASQRGDLYLNVEIKPHPFFQFEGDNLVCEIPIALDEAALGAQVEVPTPDGLVTVTIPAGIRSGQSLRLRGKGWVNAKGDRTDQIVKVTIAAPKELSATERELYEKLRNARSKDPRSSLKNVSL